MKILYFSCMEDTYKNDIHRNQILALSGHGIDYKYLFLSPLFILNRRGFSINKNKFGDSHVKEIKLPILSYNFNMHLIVIPYFLLISLIPFLYSVKKANPDVVHCRNLVSTFLAIFMRNLFSLKYKVVCDPRSVYVEECVIGKTFRYKGINYNGWKCIERWIYKKSDACIGLSEFFTEYLKSFNNNSYFIPAVVGDSAIYSKQRREELRTSTNINNSDIICCYIGSIGLWHSIENMISDIQFLIKHFKNNSIKIVFLSGNIKACQIVQDTFGSEMILKCGRVAPNEILDYLLLSDIGLVPGSKKNGYCYDLLYDTMISSKAEEYLVAGLPILVNPKIKSLAKIVEDNDAGYVSLDNLFKVKIFNRQSISDIFKNMFCVSQVVSQYKDLYNKILYK